MKLQGKITFLISTDGATIEIEDDKANTTFVKVNLTPSQLMACLSRQGYVDCELFVSGLDRVGKTHENMEYTFEIPEKLNNSSHQDELQKIAQSQLTDGWIAEGYFGSQNSFCRKDGKQYARCIIRRYV